MELPCLWQLRIGGKLLEAVMLRTWRIGGKLEAVKAA